MFVHAGMGDGNPHFVKTCRPLQAVTRLLHGLIDGFKQRRQKIQRQRFHAFGLRHINLITALKLGYGHIAHILIMHTPQQVKQDAFAHGALRNGHRLNFEFLKQRQHDGKASSNDRFSVDFQPGNIHILRITGADQLFTQPFQAIQRDGSL